MLTTWGPSWFQITPPVFSHGVQARPSPGRRRKSSMENPFGSLAAVRAGVFGAATVTPQTPRSGTGQSRAQSPLVNRAECA